MSITLPGIGRSAYTGSKSFQKATDSLAAFIQYMSINHGRTHILEMSKGSDLQISNTQRALNPFNHFYQRHILPHFSAKQAACFSHKKSHRRA